MTGDPARWARIRQVFPAALERTPAERAAFLREACGGDRDLEREVESLLAAHADAGSFAEQPAIMKLTESVVVGIGATVGTSDGPVRRRQLGPYDLAECLGVGGMGEVYRARDAKLGRDVAVKVLPAAFEDDPDRLARFEREARLLAALNHPNIATIHGLEHCDGVPCLVMELVPGETLAKRLTRGPQRIEDALAVGGQIAAALEAAHEKGIVHRDLKPANIKITPAGVVKVLDFGLAKMLAADGPGASVSSELTITAGATREGVLVGTAPYMSPEQARGYPVDKRTDIWAFGCVLYEMLTGRASFLRETIPDTLAAVLERDPDWDALPAETPLPVGRLLRRCLEKDLTRRLRDFGDLRLEIEDVLQTPGRHASATVAPIVSARPRLARLSATVLAAAVALGSVGIVLYIRREPDLAPPTRVSISAPGQITAQLSATISPDGRSVAFVSTEGSGPSRLWVRDLDSLEPRVLPGTDDAAHPFWSPDGKSLGFVAAGKLKRVDASVGSRVLTLADVSARLGASWGRDGTILFVRKFGELAAVRASGGPVSTVLTRGEAAWPFFLPDGRHFLFVDRSGSDPTTRGLYVGSLGSSDAKHVLTTDFKAAYADPGYLLFVRGETLLGQRFDAARLELLDEPAVVADGIWVARGAAQASFSVSFAGSLAYVNATLWNRQLTWFDRAGRSLGSVGAPDRYRDQVPQIAPDGSRLAIARGPYGNEDIWVTSLEAGTATRLTFEPGGESEPMWSSDGRRVLFQSNGPDGLGLVFKDSGGAGSEEAVGMIPGNGHLMDWSRDGRFVVYATVGKQRTAELWILPVVGGDRRAYPFAQTAFNMTQAQIAPNGRWIAYTSYESGRDEVYVQSFPVAGSRQQISTEGGVQPRWRRDGAELFYLATNENLMAVPVKTEGAFEAGRSTVLFRTRIIPEGSQSIWFDTLYDVTPDGQRFLINEPPEDPGPPITVVLNWLGALKK